MLGYMRAVVRALRKRRLLQIDITLDNESIQRAALTLQQCGGALLRHRDVDGRTAASAVGPCGRDRELPPPRPQIIREKLGRPLFSKIGFTSFGLHLQKIFHFRFAK